MRGCVHSHETLPVVGGERLLLPLKGSDFDLNHPQVLISTVVVDGDALDRVLLRHQGRIEVVLSLLVDRKQKFVELMLSYLETIHHRIIVDADVQHSSL